MQTTSQFDSPAPRNAFAPLNMPSKLSALVVCQAARFALNLSAPLNILEKSVTRDCAGGLVCGWVGSCLCECFFTKKDDDLRASNGTSASTNMLSWLQWRPVRIAVSLFAHCGWYYNSKTQWTFRRTNVGSRISRNSHSFIHSQHYYTLFYF